MIECTWGTGRLKELNVDVSRSGLVVGVDMRHERVPRAVHAFADDATVLLLSLGMFVRDVPLQGRL